MADPVDPTQDPAFMKAAPHEQMDYLTHTDPAFAKASPQDQMGYLMHIRGLSPSASGTSLGATLADAPKAATTMQPSYTDIGMKGGTTGEGIRNPQQPAERFALENPDQQGLLLGAAGIGAVGAVGVGAGLAGPVMSGLKNMASGAIKAAPYIAASEAINYARQKMPGGKFIPPGAEMLPLFMAGAKGEPAQEPAGTKPPPISWPEGESAPSPTAPPPVKWAPNQEPVAAQTPPPAVRWPQAMEPQQTATAPPPIRWADKAPAQALEDIKTAAAESPYQVQNIPTAGVKSPAVQGADPFSGPRAPAQMEQAQSTTIQSHGYHPESQTMTVQFKNGKTYAYSGVPPEVYDQYRNSESQGSFFSQNIKGRYKTDFKGTVKPTPGQQVKQALGGSQ